MRSKLLIFLALLLTTMCLIAAVDAEPIRDVAVIEVTTSTDQAYPGWIVDINVTVANLGDGNETFDVTSYYDSNKIATQEVKDLEPGQNRTLTFAWNTTGLTPCNTYTIKANATIVEGDANTTNNELFDGTVKIKILGDVNNDGVVNIKDAVEVGVAFASKPGDLSWNMQADLNQDGYVNVKDIIALGSNFGKSHP